MTFQEWQSKQRRMSEIAEHISRSRIRRAWYLARLAFGYVGPDAGEPFAIGTTLHNALLARDNGKPWPEVNYSLARKAMREADRAFEGSRIVERWNARVWPTVQR